MLILTRRLGESIVIGENADVKIFVLAGRGNMVKLDSVIKILLILVKINDFLRFVAHIRIKVCCATILENP